MPLCEAILQLQMSVCYLLQWALNRPSQNMSSGTQQGVSRNSMCISYHCLIIPLQPRRQIAVLQIAVARLILPDHCCLWLLCTRPTFSWTLSCFMRAQRCHAPGKKIHLAGICSRCFLSWIYVCCQSAVLGSLCSESSCQLLLRHLYISASSFSLSDVVGSPRMHFGIFISA